MGKPPPPRRGAASPTSSKATGTGTNPFESRANSRTPHHGALNRRVRGAERNVAEARARAREGREERWRATRVAATRPATRVADRRFGGRERGVDAEGKALGRLQRLRTKQSKFALDLDEAAAATGTGTAATVGLTHRGRGLAELLSSRAFANDQLAAAGVDLDDDGGSLANGDEDDDGRAMGAEEMVEMLKAGGHLESAPLDGVQRSRKEIMADVIKKSRLLRRERQKEKEEDDDAREKLDEMTHEILGQLTLRSSLSDAERRALDKATGDDAGPDEYERAVFELSALPRQAPATERTKTPLELAMEEREELEKLEAARRKRAEEAPLEGEDLPEEDGEVVNPKRRRRADASSSAKASAKDEDDDDQGEDDADVEKKLAKADTSAPFIIPVPDSHTSMLEFLGQYPTAPLDLVLARARKSNSALVRTDNRPKLERLFDLMLDHLEFIVDFAAATAAPAETQTQTHEALRTDVDALTKHLYEMARDDVGPSFAGAAFLKRVDRAARALDAHLARALAPAAAPACGGDWGCLEATTAIVPPKRGFGGAKGQAALKIAREEQIEAERTAHARGGGVVPTSPMRCWPSPGLLALGLTATKVFSSTDLRHPVCTSLALLCSRWLSECPVRGVRDVVSSLQVAALAHELARQDVGARFVPEVCVALVGTWRSLAAALSPNSIPAPDVEVGGATDGKRAPTLPGCFAAPATMGAAVFADIARALRTTTKKSQADSVGATDVALFGFAHGQSPVHVSLPLAASLVESCARLTKDVAESLTDLLSLDAALGAVPELMGSVSRACGAPARSRVASVLEDCAATTGARVAACLEAREPLRCQDFAPEAIKSFTPSFVENFRPTSGRGLDSADIPEREANRLLKRQLKRERKGLARELRLDAQFQADARQRERAEKLSGLREERYKNLVALQTQQSEFNKLVKKGIRVSGAGAGGMDMKGYKRGKPLAPS